MFRQISCFLDFYETKIDFVTKFEENKKLEICGREISRQNNIDSCIKLTIQTENLELNFDGNTRIMLHMADCVYVLFEQRQCVCVCVNIRSALPWGRMFTWSLEVPSFATSKEVNVFIFSIISILQNL